MSGEPDTQRQKADILSTAFVTVLANTAGKMLAQANDCRKDTANQT